MNDDVPDDAQLDGDLADDLLHDRPVQRYLKQCVTIVPEALPGELTDVPGQVAYTNARVADAQRAYNAADIDLKRLRAQLRVKLRGELEKATGKRPTVDAVADAMDDDPSYIDALLKRANADAELLAAQGWAKATQAKLAACLALSGLLREELRGDPALRAAAASATRG